MIQKVIFVNTVTSQHELQISFCTAIYQLKSFRKDLPSKMAAQWTFFIHVRTQNRQKLKKIEFELIFLSVSDIARGFELFQLLLQSKWKSSELTDIKLFESCEFNFDYPILYVIERTPLLVNVGQNNQKNRSTVFTKNIPIGLSHWNVRRMHLKIWQFPQKTEFEKD